MFCGVRDSASASASLEARPGSRCSRCSASRRAVLKERGTKPRPPSVLFTARLTSGSSSGVHGKVLSARRPNHGLALRSLHSTRPRFRSRASTVPPPPQKKAQRSSCCGVSHVCARSPEAWPKAPTADQARRGSPSPASRPSRMATITRSSLSAIERLALSPGSLLDVKAAASAAPVILALITAARGRAGRGGSRGVDESHEPPDIFAWITAARGRVRRGCVYEQAVSAVSANVTTTCCIVNRGAQGGYTRGTRLRRFFHPCGASLVCKGM